MDNGRIVGLTRARREHPLDVGELISTQGATQPKGIQSIHRSPAERTVVVGFNRGKPPEVSQGSSLRKTRKVYSAHGNKGDEPNLIDLESLVADMKLSHPGWLASGSTTTETNEELEQKYVIEQDTQFKVTPSLQMKL